MNGLVPLSPNQVNGKCRWVVRPVTLPEGTEGILRITSFTRRGQVSHNYIVRVTGYGFQLEKEDGTTYDINTEWGEGQWQCDCGDHIFRHRECKHCLSVRAAFKRVEA